VENAFLEANVHVPFFPVVGKEDEKDDVDVHNIRFLVWVGSLDVS
jgi:hypothetical protein